MKSLAEARINFESAIGTLGDRFIAGINRADWAGKAGSEQAEANYAAGVQKAVSAKSRQSGVKKVTNAEWQAAAATKGGAVIGTRVRESLDKWEANFGPVFAAVVADIQRLPARTTDAMSNIDMRLKPTVKSWQKHSPKAR